MKSCVVERRTGSHMEWLEQLCVRLPGSVGDALSSAQVSLAAAAKHVTPVEILEVCLGPQPPPSKYLLLQYASATETQGVQHDLHPESLRKRLTRGCCDRR